MRKEIAVTMTYINSLIEDARFRPVIPVNHTNIGHRQHLIKGRDSGLRMPKLIPKTSDGTDNTR